MTKVFTTHLSARCYMAELYARGVLLRQQELSRYSHWHASVADHRVTVLP